MDAEQIRQLKPQLTRYLKRFEDCFARKDTRKHFPVYVEGQLSELSGKSVEPIAKHAGVPVRTLQEFLALHKWDHDRMRDRLQGIVAAEHSGKHSIGILDETSFVKKGDKTPGVQRQHCGTVGKQENCMATVHLAYAAGDFHCLIDGELFLPESWSDDRTRCDEAGIPEDMVYRPKWKIALELVERCLQDQKSELGLDDYEGRRYLGLKRHLVPASVSYLFLARVHQKLRGKKPELTVCQVHTAVGALVRS